MRNILLTSVLLFCSVVFSQNKQLLFGFKEIPQNLMVNPGSDIAFDGHVGFPLVSGVSAEGNIKDFTAYDVFGNDGVDFNQKLRNLVYGLDSRAHASVNQQIDIINAGFRLANNDYLSFGIYQEFDAIGYNPQDIAILYYQGNTQADELTPILDKPIKLNHIAFEAELLSVLHVGLNRKINDKLTVGARAKLYSGAYNIDATGNRGTITTVRSDINSYQHQFRNINFAYRSSGIDDNDDASNSPVKNTLNRLFFSGNLGLGIDAGFTYKLKRDIVVSGSIQDLGLVSYRNKTRNLKFNGDYNLNGIDLQPADINNPQQNYWDALLNEFDTALNKDENTNTYVTFRPFKLNGSVAYHFGKEIEKRKLPRRRGKGCSCEAVETMLKIRKNEVGGQLYMVHRAKQPQIALTAFYYRRIFEALRAKVTYTADSYSKTNIGLGVSTHLGGFNFYATVDNLLGFRDLAKSHTQSVQFGFNWVID